MTTDHAAKAEQILAELRRDPGLEPRDRLIAIAQVHATLATRQEPAGHPVTPYREDLAAWREAVLELFDWDAVGRAGVTELVVPIAALDRIRALLGNPS